MNTRTATDKGLYCIIEPEVALMLTGFRSRAEDSDDIIRSIVSTQMQGVLHLHDEVRVCSFSVGYDTDRYIALYMAARMITPPRYLLGSSTEKTPGVCFRDIFLEIFLCHSAQKGAS